VNRPPETNVFHYPICGIGCPKAVREFYLGGHGESPCNFSWYVIEWNGQRSDIVQLKDGRTLTIRKAEKTDARQLIDYMKIALDESDNLTMSANEFTMTVEQEEQFIENVNSSAASATLVGFVDGALVCVGNVSAHTKTRMAHWAGIGMSVLRAYWGMGVGTALMSEIVAFAKSTGTLEILELEVRADNAHAISIYERVGFQKFGYRPKAFKLHGEYHDNILMHLEL